MLTVSLVRHRGALVLAVCLSCGMPGHAAAHDDHVRRGSVLLDREAALHIVGGALGDQHGVRGEGQAPVAQPVRDPEDSRQVAAMQRAFVDYTWLSNARVDFDQPISGRTSIIGTAYGDVYGVDHDSRARRVCGGRLEGGVRINGRKAAVELFAGYERRVDAYPTDRYRVRMFNAGFRVVSK